MQLVLLALVLGVFVHDGLYLDAPLLLSPTWVIVLALAPKVLAAALYSLACALTLRRLGRRGGAKAVRWLERATNAYRIVALALYVLDLHVGVLRLIRTGFDVVLLDELLALLPTFALLVWGWWAYYPIEKRVREASLIALADSGEPIYRIWTRGQYLVFQLRHQAALILVPALLFLAWMEAAGQYGRLLRPWLGHEAEPLLAVIGSVTIFLLAPLMLRYIWDTAPLPRGELRDMLTALCQRHRVRVRELLLWRTATGGGGMINAAVMGLLPPLRYILVTDALLDALRRDQVEAVMAHELGHVRRRHMYWLLAAALASLGIMQLLVSLGIEAAFGAPAAFADDRWWREWRFASPEVASLLGGAAAIFGWVIVFGWVSRRVERQADTFAVQSMAAARAGDAPGDVRVDEASVEAMVSALGQVADLNYIPLKRNSWRHGSIQWRQDHLRSLVGLPIDRLPIDAQMRWIKLATLLAIALLIASSYFLPAEVQPTLLVLR